MNTPTLNLALDPGFGGCKTALINGRGPEAHTLPSVIGSGTMRKTYLNTGLKRSKTNNPYQVRFEGYDYLVGANVHRYRTPLERLDFQRLGDGLENRALVYGAIYQALGDGDHYLNLLIGLPVEVTQDNPLLAATMRGLRSWLVGQHEYSVDGQIVSLDIRQVKAMAQPLGSLFYWGTNNQGQWIQSDDARARYAIADVGRNTLDAFVVENADVSERFTRGNTLGMRQSLTVIWDQVRDQYGIDLSLYEADELMMSRLKGKPAIISHATGENDITNLIDQALADNAAQIANFLSKLWGNGRQFRRVLLTGGGAEALRSQLTDLYPYAIVLPSAQQANVIGLAKFAQRPNVFK